MTAPDATPRWQRIAPLSGVAALAILPAWWWIARDHGVWPWDTAHMGNYALQLWEAFNPFSPTWWRELLTGMTGKAPGLPWISEPFAGLGDRIMGNALTGLLVFQVLVQVTSAVLIHRTATHLTRNHRVAGWLAAGIFLAAPLSMGLSVRYYTEPLQTMAVAYFWWAVITIPRNESWRRTLHALIAATLGSITKVSTPLYLMVPLVWLVFDLVRSSREHGWKLDSRHRRRIPWLGVVAGVGAVVSRACGLLSRNCSTP